MKLCITWVVSALFISLVMGCSSPAEVRERNIDYMKNTIGRIIIDYKTAKNVLPATFSEALSASGRTLAHRGDFYGHPFTYRQLGPTRFQLHCKGADGKLAADDLTLIWSEEHGWHVTDGPPPDRNESGSAADE